MTTPVILLAVLSGFISLGAVGLVLAAFFWTSVVRKFFHDDWLLPITLVTKAIQVIAGATSYLAAGVPPGDESTVWNAAKFAGLFCIGVWEAIGITLTQRVRAAEKAEKQTLEEREALHTEQLALLERETIRRTTLLTAFRIDINRRLGMLNDARTRTDIRSDIGRIRAALRPDTLLVEYLLILATTLADWIKTEHNEERNIRVGLYVNRGGGMTPIFTTNLNNSSDRVGMSQISHPEAFRLDGEPAHRSHVVACVKRKGMILVADCREAQQAGEFHFFHDDQQDYLKSMAAYYLGELIDGNGAPTEAALVVDTDLSGFFCEANRASLELCLREFGVRLQYERLLSAVITRKAGGHE